MSEVYDLLDLYPMSLRWHASYRDGNMTITGPTSFEVTMSRADVLAAIRAKTPGIRIAPKALAEGPDDALMAERAAKRQPDRTAKRIAAMRGSKGEG